HLCQRFMLMRIAAITVLGLFFVFPVLTGRAQTEQQSQEALARSDARVAGVKAVNDDDLLVTWWSRDDMQRKTVWADLDDDDIREAVNDALLYDPRVFSFKPTVSVDNGVVTLTGVVDNLKAKRAAAQDAKNTVGVTRVKNYLKVRPVSERPDDEIKQDILNALARDPYVDRFDIEPIVIGGEVWLHGDVNSYYEKSQAEDLAATVNGVTNVHNYLDVSYDPPALTYDYYDWDPTLYDYDFDYTTTRVKPDSEIKDDIESQLLQSPALLARIIHRCVGRNK
ncbi:MAG: BON domain-containing protein, partial [Candidatus Paceibacterota bacterium]